MKESHRQLRDAMRANFRQSNQNIIPNASRWEEDETLPKEIYRQVAKDDVLMPMAAGKSIPSELAGKFPIMGGMKPEEWDGFHDFVIHDELNRVRGIVVLNGLIGGVNMLAITEPDAGSDVSALATEAVLTRDGKSYKVSGQKKVCIILALSPWSELNADATYADNFLALTKTSADGMIILLIPKCERVSVRNMKMSGSSSAGTAFVGFDNVLVPLENVVGEAGQGFTCIVSNFNYERLFISFQSVRASGVCLEDSISYASSRETFGKKLIEHPVIRLKLAHMARKTETLQAWIEVRSLSSKHTGIVLQAVRDAIQILGGIGLTRVLAGSEEIILDLSVRRAVRMQEVLEGKRVVKSNL
ncbi:uncharacterized protein PAC_17930 [Phialocephala subalpina]|uniref:Acyl-CoA dehydrogenase n=1 Tax=Phialocephala subalpina TaxID=576137 RepID=A0A1L7XSL5_9HELO|nr:uncharacterized protein PAC_17930 [Phialocephala subalpina]